MAVVTIIALASAFAITYINNCLSFSRIVLDDIFRQSIFPLCLLHSIEGSKSDLGTTGTAALSREDIDPTGLFLVTNGTVTLGWVGA